VADAAFSTPVTPGLPEAVVSAGVRDTVVKPKRDSAGRARHALFGGARSPPTTGKRRP